MQTRKYPRTMQEAFGPYIDHELQPMDSRQGYDLGDKLTIAASIAGIVFVFAFIAIWG